MPIGNFISDAFNLRSNLHGTFEARCSVTVQWRHLGRDAHICKQLIHRIT